MPSDEALALLRSIDASLKLLVRQQQGVEVADDRDLDGRYGNPTVKFIPRDWSGADCRGLPMSDCPAEFLDVFATTLDYLARKADDKNETTSGGKPVSEYKRRDAARARGWAKRIRAGKVPATSTKTDSESGWSEQQEGDWS